MRLNEIFTADSIFTGFDPGDRSKAAVIRHLAGELARVRNLDDEQRIAMEEALIAREEQGSTGVGKGLAVPHGKADAVPGLIAGLAVCAEGKGVDFGAPDGPATVIVVMASDFSSSADHVAALAAVSRLAQDEGNAATLNGGDAAAIHALLGSAE
ncbi:MAG: PTS sugar transporter subunit IIA [Planctomycetota bacterium]|jgi:mannitol/fructose-specific phosphotransferase system IIA component (Ntr-type)